MLPESVAFAFMGTFTPRRVGRRLNLVSSAFHGVLSPPSSPDVCGAPRRATMARVELLFAVMTAASSCCASVGGGFITLMAASIMDSIDKPLRRPDAEARACTHYDTSARTANGVRSRPSLHIFSASGLHLRPAAALFTNMAPPPKPRFLSAAPRPNRTRPSPCPAGLAQHVLHEDFFEWDYVTKADFLKTEILLGITICFAQVHKPESVAFAFMAHIKPPVALQRVGRERIIALLCACWAILVVRRACYARRFMRCRRQGARMACSVVAEPICVECGHAPSGNPSAAWQAGSYALEMEQARGATATIPLV